MASQKDFTSELLQVINLRVKKYLKSCHLMVICNLNKFFQKNTSLILFGTLQIKFVNKMTLEDHRRRTVNTSSHKNYASKHTKKNLKITKKFWLNVNQNCGRVLGLPFMLEIPNIKILFQNLVKIIFEKPKYCTRILEHAPNATKIIFECDIPVSDKIYPQVKSLSYYDGYGGSGFSDQAKMFPNLTKLVLDSNDYEVRNFYPRLSHGLLKLRMYSRIPVVLPEFLQELVLMILWNRNIVFLPMLPDSLQKLKLCGDFRYESMWPLSLKDVTLRGIFDFKFALPDTLSILKCEFNTVTNSHIIMPTKLKCLSITLTCETCWFPSLNKCSIEIFKVRLGYGMRLNIYYKNSEIADKNVQRTFLDDNCETADDNNCCVCVCDFSYADTPFTFDIKNIKHIINPYYPEKPVIHVSEQITLQQYLSADK
jgi:hypothetical protein